MNSENSWRIHQECSNVVEQFSSDEDDLASLQLNRRMDAFGENNNETTAPALARRVSFADSPENSDDESSNSSDRLSSDSLSVTDQNEYFFDEDNDLPELEDDPRQRIPAGVYARPEDTALPESDEDERECWVCFMGEDDDNPGAEWCTPCKCQGSVGFVHQDCVKRWVAEKQKHRLDLEVECPQCGMKYRFVFPKMNPLFYGAARLDQYINNCVFVVTCTGVIAALNLATMFYTRNVIKCIVVDEFVFESIVTDSCYTLSPYRQMLVEMSGLKFEGFDRFLSSLTITVFPISLFLNIPKSIMAISSRATEFLWSYFCRGLKDTLISWAVPATLVTLRKINWDEPLLNKIAEYQNTTQRYDPPREKSTRYFIGGLMMPFCARIVGDIVYPQVTPGRRFVYGAATYLLGKGIYNFTRKYLTREWQRKRKVKNYVEGQPHEDENNLPQTFSIELLIGRDV